MRTGNAALRAVLYRYHTEASSDLSIPPSPRVGDANLDRAAKAEISRSHIGDGEASPYASQRFVVWQRAKSIAAESTRCHSQGLGILFLQISMTVCSKSEAIWSPSLRFSRLARDSKKSLQEVAHLGGHSDIAADLAEWRHC